MKWCLFFLLLVQKVTAFNLTSNSHSAEILEEISQNVTVVEFVQSIIEKMTVDTDQVELALNSSMGNTGPKPALFCQVVQLKNVYYFYGVIGDQYHYGVTSIGSCLYLCVISNYERRSNHGDTGDDHDCKAVNYFAYHKACQLLNTGMERLETTDKRLYGPMNGATHAFIQFCYGPDGESSTAATKKPTWPPFPTQAPPFPSSVACGISAYPPVVAQNSDKQRIIRGQEAKAHSWPWVILFNLNFGHQRSFCGGTLLRLREDVEESDVVLTAAHCVTRPETQGTIPTGHDVSYMSVIAGDHRRHVQEIGEVHRHVSAVRFHSQFRFTPETGAVNDVALLKLNSPIQFNEIIRPVCLPEQGDPIPSSSLCVAAGWGRNDSRYLYVMPDALQQLVVPVQDADTCRNGWGSIYNEREMLCAGTLTGTASTCQGDSGGMLACKSHSGRWVQQGVTSFGVGGTCLQPHRPSVFARVSSYVDWIKRNAHSLSTLISTVDNRVDGQNATSSPQAEASA